MLLPFCFLPFVGVKFREERVGVLGFLIYQRDIHSAGKRQCRLIESGAADDEHFFRGIAITILCAMAQCLIERGVYLTTRQRAERGAHHYVAAPWQSSVGKRLESVPSHDDGVTPSCALEMGEVFWQVPRQCAAAAYRAVARHGNDDADEGMCELFIFHSCG